MIGYMALMTSAREYTQYTDWGMTTHLSVCKNCELDIRQEDNEMIKTGNAARNSE